MGVEIERKFLVASDSWRGQGEASRMVQGYLHNTGGYSVRVRVAGEVAWVTIKGRVRGAVRSEYEYEIPVADANEILELCPEAPIDKTRHTMTLGKDVWEVDEFHGANAGLVVAEIELDDPEQEFERPDWLGREVTADARYLNANLVRRPFSTWGAER